jgi:hypothetical protein
MRFHWTKIIIIAAAGILLLLVLKNGQNEGTTDYPQSFWNVRSIDTMKYSRDVAREKLTDPSFDEVIERQVSAIAATGATHVAIATPYDEEFIPFLKRWVSSARKHNLKVWFRGNFSGWEEWFDYPSISRAEHITKTYNFIHHNFQLFEDGDIFTSCPECENGGPGDPRNTGDVTGYRKFLIEEYQSNKKAFEKIRRNVTSNYFSMNGDVARLIMDKDTTKALDGIVTIDHYVRSPEKLVLDIYELAESSGGKIVLGEYGVPIPDIHGELTEQEQTDWLRSAFEELAESKKVVGLNYWVNVGGSTELWRADGRATAAVAAVKEYYQPRVIKGFIKNELDRPVKHARLTTPYAEVAANEFGYFEIPFVGTERIMVSAPGFETTEAVHAPDQSDLILTLKKTEEGFWFRFVRSLRDVVY